MTSREYANDVPAWEIEQRKMEALESIAESLRGINFILDNTTAPNGRLVVLQGEY